MSGNDSSAGRRTVLKTIGTGAIMAAGVTGSTSAAVTPDFDPSQLDQINEFLENTFGTNVNIIRKIEQNDLNKEQQKAFKQLSEHQARALADSLRPIIMQSSTRTIKHNSTLHAGSTATIQGERRYEVMEDDLTKKWDWDIETDPQAHEFENSLDVMSSHLDAMSNSSLSYYMDNTLEARALSVDWVGYKWRGELSWDYHYDDGWEYDTADTVLHTNYAVSHESSDIDVLELSTIIRATYEAEFSNSAYEICVPFSDFCINLSPTFNPYMDFEADKNGWNRVAEEDNGTVL